MKPPARPTINDVARRAEVSITAVSFVFNDRPGIAEATRRRILAAADELGWTPSARARALTSARSGAIGLVLARDLRRLELDPFLVRFLAGVERALGRYDHALVLRVFDAPDERADLAAYAQLVGAGRVDGFLLTDVRIDDPRYALLSELDVPAVIAGRPNGPCPFPAVETDHAAGMRGLVEHLLAIGHTNVGFVGGFAGYEHIVRRRAEWHAALVAAGHPPGPAAHADAADPGGATAAAAVLDAHPTAIVFTSDLLAATGLRVAADRGLRVPADVTLAGFDDSAISALAGLATVRIDYTGFGEAAAETLMRLLAGEPLEPFQPAPPQLELRTSVGPPAERAVTASHRRR